MICFIRIMLALSFCAVSLAMKDDYVERNYVENGVAKYALSFDDGPYREGNVALLDTLRKKNIKAGFFYVGINVNTTKYPRVQAHVRTTFAEGHLIGSHSYSHKDYSLVTEETFIDNTRRNDALLRKVLLGFRPLFFRFPYHSFGPSGNIQRFLNSSGYITLGWNFDSVDWAYCRKNLSSEVIMENAEKLAVLMSQNPGGLALFHDCRISGELISTMLDIIQRNYSDTIEIVDIWDILTIKGLEYVLEGYQCRSAAHPLTSRVCSILHQKYLAKTRLAISSLNSIEEFEMYSSYSEEFVEGSLSSIGAASISILYVVMTLIVMVPIVLLGRHIFRRMQGSSTDIKVV